jgi:CRP/FNR family transcriptional regulator, cyclic AMP receptor protein
MNSSTLSEIPAIGYLVDVSEEHRKFLAGFGKFVRLDAGLRLINEGEPQDVLYLILSGTLHVTANADGRSVLLATLTMGDTIGEINLFDPIAASANVTSIKHSLIWSLTRGELETLFQTDPKVGISLMKGILRQVSSRIRGMNDKLITSQKEVFFDFWNNHNS